MSHNDLNARLDPGRYTYSVTTILGPPRPGRNRSDDWVGSITARPGSTVRDALQLIASDVARDKGVGLDLVHIISYSLQKV